MASLARKYSKEKLNGVVYTPDFIVCKILDDVEYNSPKILGKKILDPACGDGRFLTEIAKRIIEFSSENELKNNLECIFGWDIDKNAIEKCVENLNDLIKNKKIAVNWNITCANSIKKHQKANLFCENTEKFDYIVGNPPYIRIQHLEKDFREYIQYNFDFCQSGSTDIYIAFYELCLNLLNENGVCGLITPNTFLSTETAKAMRNDFAEKQNLIQITNYGDIQLFENATTYSAITIFDLKKHEAFVFQKAISKNEFEEKIVLQKELNNKFWNFSKTSENGIKLKEICKISVGITTLCDKAYIFSVEEIDDKFVLANTKLRGKIKIEKSILKPIVKGSKLKSQNQPIKEFVLFPYKKINGKNQIIPEKELKEIYPLAFAYLLSVKSELDKRDAGKPNPVAWYAFGRSQGLDTSFGEKIIFSPMNDKPNFIYYKNPDCTFYSGYSIKYKGNKDELLFQLNSERMANFVAASSRDFRGGWKAYNKKVVDEFEVSKIFISAVS